MGSNAEGRAQDNFIKNRSRGIDDELAALGGLHNAAQIAGVDLSDGNGALFAEKTPRADRIAVTAPNGVALTVKKLREEGAGRPRSQDEDPHGVGKTVPQEKRGACQVLKADSWQELG
jgi:hypothetical protein